MPNIDDKAAALQAVYEAQQVLRDAIQRARTLGVSWDDIGAGLGITGERAQRRWGSWIANDPETDSTAD